VVLDADTSMPIVGVRVSARLPQPAQSSRFATSDNDGRFALDVVPDGAIEVHAERDHYTPANVTVNVSGGASQPVEIRLGKGSSAAVRIVDAGTGTELDAFVSLFDSKNKVVATGMNREEDGAIHIWAGPGQYTARVNATGYLPQSVGVTIPGAEVRVPLARGARLLINSRSGGSFRVTEAVSPPPPTPGVGGYVTGNFLVKVLPGMPMTIEGRTPGTYEVDRVTPDGKTVLNKYTVTLVSGQTATLDVD
jgi:hypothetical protein